MSHNVITTNKGNSISTWELLIWSGDSTYLCKGKILQNEEYQRELALLTSISRHNSHLHWGRQQIWMLLNRVYEPDTEWFCLASLDVLVLAPYCLIDDTMPQIEQFFQEVNMQVLVLDIMKVGLSKFCLILTVAKYFIQRYWRRPRTNWDNSNSL